ncbi:hypothetical protein CHS0354_034159 [Potamilus streckersoni]|uniref:RING-type domain-containing protein n=1 Tax=Potamilus streckersoni TaxID=2493646 RepID=A0AAE0RN33_9BIVA|nr:hypothetical protein CHS0354_034159 [Potamilus streckersoni]
MINNVLDTLWIYLDANDFRISFMEYNSEDSSFKPKHKNKNYKEQIYSFSEKLHHRIRRFDSLSPANCVITSDKLLKDTNAVESQIISTHRNKKPIKVVEPGTQVHGRINSKSASVYYAFNFYPLHGAQNKNPLFPGYTDDTRTTGISLQESIRYMVQRPNQITDQNYTGLGLQPLSLQNGRNLYDTSNSYSETAHSPMKYEDSKCTMFSGQFVSRDSASNITLEVNISQEASKHEIGISGSSFERTHQLQHNEIGSNNARVSATDYRFPAPLGIQQNRPFCPELSGDKAFAHHQQQIKQPETNVNEFVRPQDVARQHDRIDDLLHVLGRVRSPENANLTDRLHSFSRWPSGTTQTPVRVAEAGFYYTEGPWKVAIVAGICIAPDLKTAGYDLVDRLQDIVRCFACDGGLKNWDPDDDPWVEHARWFPQCAFVRHIKGEEFINLVRRMAEESDDEDDTTVYRGATWGGVENSIIYAESASNEVTEPSVLENKAAQFVLELGYSEKHVAVAINDILKKGKLDFTGQEIIDVILEKKTCGERIDSKLAANGLPSARTSLADEQTMSENKRLKKLLQCTECKTKERNMLFLPCTHHVVCESCSRDLHICTFCYRKIKEKVRTYMV